MNEELEAVITAEGQYNMREILQGLGRARRETKEVAVLIWDHSGSMNEGLVIQPLDIQNMPALDFASLYPMNQMALDVNNIEDPNDPFINSVDDFYV